MLSPQWGPNSQYFIPLLLSMDSSEQINHNKIFLDKDSGMRTIYPKRLNSGMKYCELTLHWVFYIFVLVPD